MEKNKMEKIAKDIINAGIGAVETIKKIIDENTANLQNTFKEMAAKGAADTSENAQKIRENVDKALGNIEELRTKVDGYVQEQQEKLNETIDKIKTSLPDLKIDDLKTKVDELTQNIKTAFNKKEGEEPKAEEEPKTTT
jgi:ABC-type transporter Mla subunit MlaD